MKSPKPQPELLLSQHDWFLAWLIIAAIAAAILCGVAFVAAALIAGINVYLELGNPFPVNPPKPAPESSVSIGLFFVLLAPVAFIAQVLGAICDGSNFIWQHLQSLPAAGNVMVDSLRKLWP